MTASRRTVCILAACFGTAASALAQPVVAPWPAGGGATGTTVAAAALSGWTATADPTSDTVVVRDMNGAVVRTVTAADLLTAAPWLDVSTAGQGPMGLTFSDSGRLLYVAVVSTGLAGDNLPRSTIVRLDCLTGLSSSFARLDLSSTRPSMVHTGGRLAVAAAGNVSVYRATLNDAGGLLLSASNGVGYTSLAVDRLTGDLYATTSGGVISQLRRASILTVPLSFAPVMSVPTCAALAWSDHYGDANGAGLYVMTDQAMAPTAGQLLRLSPAQARGTAGGSPAVYLTGALGGTDLAATADGRLLLATGTGAVSVRDAGDPRPGYSGWLMDEFNQTVTFARRLFSPDGQPPGWVIDGDVQLGWTRFHPASPDAACMTVLLLLASDRLTQDPLAQQQVRTVLMRYGGLMPDGIRPLRSTDGIFWHWIEPSNGQAKAGWGDSYATLSTMLIVAAASRAAAYYPNDPQIQHAAQQIICGVKHWDSYTTLPGGIYFLGNAGGGPTLNTRANMFHEGIVFCDQASAFGGVTADAVYGNVMNRSLWPSATLVTGRPVTGDVSNQFQSAFVSMYPMLLMPSFRSSPSWVSQMANIRLSNAAWTDDNRPRYYTVFSAGTTRSDWGGYHADAIFNSPGNVTTFPAVMGLAGAPGAVNPSAEAVAAYNAYRRGARQTFLTGASILYRRSSVDPTYQPDSAGLPDVGYGALGLAELISPGTIDSILATAYWPCPRCVADIAGIGGLPPTDGTVTGDDFVAFINAFADGSLLADIVGIGGNPPPDNAVTGDDFVAFINSFAGGCP